MLLIGRDLSPFTRRVAVSMTLLGLPCERRELAVLTQGEEIRSFNPLTRVPALVVQPGEPALVESSLILGYLDSLVPPERRLLPPGDLRALRLTGLAFGAMEKGISAYYERTRRPADFTYRPWAEQCDGQVAAAFAALDRAAGEAAARGDPWLAGPRLTQADISSAVALDFLRFVAPDSLPPGRYPALEAVTGRALALPPFRATGLEKFRT